MRKKQATAHGQLAKAVTVGAGVSLVISIFTCGIGAAMIGGEIIKPENIGYLGAAALLLGSVTGSLVAIMKWKGSPFAAAGLASLAYILCLLCIGIVSFEGKFDNMMVTVLLIMGGCVSSCLLRMKKNNKNTHSKVRYKIR